MLNEPAFALELRIVSFVLRLSWSNPFLFFFFFNDTATTEIYTLSLHDALPICEHVAPDGPCLLGRHFLLDSPRSEEHTSELQSQSNLVCRLLLEKKKKKKRNHTSPTTLDRHIQHTISCHSWSISIPATIHTVYT